MGVGEGFLNSLDFTCLSLCLTLGVFSSSFERLVSVVVHKGSRGSAAEVAALSLELVGVVVDERRLVEFEEWLARGWEVVGSFETERGLVELKGRELELGEGGPEAHRNGGEQGRSRGRCGCGVLSFFHGEIK